MWASQPEPTPEERAAAWAQSQEMVREYERARRRYLQAKYGIKGAEQIERSNKKLFGKSIAIGSLAARPGSRSWRILSADFFALPTPAAGW